MENREKLNKDLAALLKQNHKWENGKPGLYDEVLAIVEKMPDEKALEFYYALMSIHLHEKLIPALKKQLNSMSDHLNQLEEMASHKSDEQDLASMEDQLKNL